jgi:hypothetical protein
MTPKEYEEIRVASVDDLKKFLITCDWRGKEFKAKALEEIIERAVRERENDFL